MHRGIWVAVLAIIGAASACAPLNNPPLLIEQPRSISLAAGFGTEEVDLSGTFTDPDDDVISVSVGSSDTNIVSAEVNRFIVTLTEGGTSGEATITCTASDPDGDIATTFFTVQVN